MVFFLRGVAPAIDVFCSGAPGTVNWVVSCLTGRAKEQKITKQKKNDIINILFRHLIKGKAQAVDLKGRLVALVDHVTFAELM